MHYGMWTSLLSVFLIHNYDTWEYVKTNYLSPD
jgi:hypothetical protein